MNLDIVFGSEGKAALKKFKKEIGSIGGRTYRMEWIGGVMNTYMGHMLHPMGYFEIRPLKDGFYVNLNFADENLTIVDSISKECKKAKDVESFILEHCEWLDYKTAKKLRKEQDELARRNKEGDE